MTLAAVLTPLPVLIPTVGAALTLFAGRRPGCSARHHIACAVGCGRVVCAVLLYLTDRDGTLALHVGGWGQVFPAWGRWASRWWWTGCRH